MDERTAILMDGGFVKKKLCRKGVPKVKEVTDLAEAIMKKPQLAGANLFRIYFYDAPPFEGKSKHPLTGETINFSGSLAASQNQALLHRLSFHLILQFDAAFSHAAAGSSGQEH